jgi:hypothetical protein
VPGFRDANVYPLAGNLDRARELARGHRRNGKAVLLVSPASPSLELAQLVKKQLAAMGLDIEIKTPPGYIDGSRPGAARGGEWDIRYVLWPQAMPDAHEYLRLALEAQLQGGETLTRVRSRLARAALARADRLPPGRARNLAYAKVDAMIARDIAPFAVLSVLKEATLVSERVGCRVLRPALDLAVACLRG